MAKGKRVNYEVKQRESDGEEKKWRKRAKGSSEEAGSVISHRARQCKWPVSGSQR